MRQDHPTPGHRPPGQAGLRHVDCGHIPEHPTAMPDHAPAR